MLTPRYGWIELGDIRWACVLDEPEEGEPHLFVDTNGDGDLRNDPPAEWKAEKQCEQTIYKGRAQLQLD